MATSTSNAITQLEGQEWDEAALKDIAEFVHERSRLYFAPKRPVLKQRLEERMSHLNLPDLPCYWRYLRSTAQEEVVLLNLLTVNETSFFRNPGQFRYLSDRIIPQLEKERGEEVVRSWGSREPVPNKSIMKIRILCAGCSTGEEPYSVAMMLCETLQYPKAWDIEILAGDLNEDCIRTAAAGYYDVERLRGLPAGFKQKYMTPRGEGAVVTDEVKNLVKFCRLNLNDVMNGGSLAAHDTGIAQFDIIFCRNVMIYFSTEAQQQLVDALFRLLAPGGYLLTGDAEPLHMYNHGFEAVREAGSLIYRKMETSKNGEAI